MFIKPFGLKRMNKVAQGTLRFVQYLQLADDQTQVLVSQKIADFLIDNVASASCVVFAHGKLHCYLSGKDKLPTESMALDSPMKQLALLFDGKKIVEIDAHQFLHTHKIKTLSACCVFGGGLEISSNNNNNNNNNNNG